MILRAISQPLDLAPSPLSTTTRRGTSILLSLNITDIVGDGALVIDVHTVVDTKSKSQFQLVYGESNLEWNEKALNWSSAEEHCVSKGGHLASMATAHYKLRLQEFAETFLFSKHAWLGGK